MHRLRREASTALFELDADLARLDPPAPEMQALICALSVNPTQAARFIDALCGTVPVEQFFACDNLARIVAEGDTTRVREEIA